MGYLMGKAFNHKGKMHLITERNWETLANE
jgi:hypothetical protein